MCEDPYLIWARAETTSQALPYREARCQAGDRTMQTQMHPPAFRCFNFKGKQTETSIYDLISTVTFAVREMSNFYLNTADLLTCICMAECGASVNVLFPMPDSVSRRSQPAPRSLLVRWL